MWQRDVSSFLFRQCLNMVNHYKFVHLSAGDLLRAEQDKKGPDAKEIEDCIKEGSSLFI